MSSAGQIRARARITVPCGRCHAVAGQPCRNMASNTPAVYLHRERLRAYLAVVSARHHQGVPHDRHDR